MRSRSALLEAAHCVTRVFRLGLEHERALIFIEGRFELSAPFVETPQPHVRVGMRRPVASARGSCEVDA
jgi:hypothetical protein